jgi:hypothetical protein
MATQKTNYQGVDTKNTFNLIPKFLGYRSREDRTILAPGYMIWPSQNVLLDISGRLKPRQGYTLDGATNTTITPIYAWYDWEERKNGTLNFRAFSGNLQFRYDNGTITWTTIKTGLGISHIRFTNYWDNTEKLNCVLFVDGSGNVYKWNGGLVTVSSVTSNTITKTGTSTWAEVGYYVVGNKKLIIRGVEYTYTGGESTTTLTGVTPDPTAQDANTPVLNDLAYQSLVTQASITNVESNFKFDGIANVNQQIYYGSANSNNIYISKVNDFTTCAYSATRLVGEGALITLRAKWVGFEPQEDVMYISAGKSQWYQTKVTLSSDNASESFTVVPLKTSAQQGALSQEAITHDRNDVVILSNETRMTTLGRTVNIFGTPMMTDYSYPVAKDFDNYNWTNASLKYYKSCIYAALPVEGKWLVFNQTDPNHPFWEAPQLGSFSGFSEINGYLYGHGYNVPETYKLFDGYSDNGNPILAKAKFSYLDYGNRGLSDYFNEFWIEGYISQNTKLGITYNLDLDGCATILKGGISGDNSQVVCLLKDTGSLGKSSLGKVPLGGIMTSDDPDPLPSYFNAVLTSVRKDFYKFSPTFESYGIDQRWEIINFGPLVTPTMYGNNKLKINLA